MWCHITVPVLAQLSLEDEFPNHNQKKGVSSGRKSAYSIAIKTFSVVNQKSGIMIRIQLFPYVSVSSDCRVQTFTKVGKCSWARRGTITGFKHEFEGKGNKTSHRNLRTIS